MSLLPPAEGRVLAQAHDFASRGRGLGQLWQERSVWQVRLRWFVPPGIALGVLVGKLIGFGFDHTPLLGVAAGILAYNLALAIAFQRAQHRPALDQTLAFIQVTLDYGALLLLLHFTGGPASPLLFFLVFHVIFAAMLFRPSTAYLFAGAAAVGTCLVTLAEVLQWLPSHPVWYQGRAVTLWDRPGHIGATLVFFTTSIFVTAALSNLIMHRLRERVMSLAEASNRVAALNDKLSSLYGMIEAAGTLRRLDQVVQITARELAKVAEIAGITVKLLSEDEQHLHYAAVAGLSHEFGSAVVALSESPCSRRVMAGETVLVEHVATSPDLARREELLALGIESIILAPLRVEQRVIGILGVYRRAPHRFVSEDAGFFELAAELVAISVENARHGEAIDHLMEERTRLMLQVAHNLRAPLSAAATMLETLGESYLGPVNAQQQDTISRIERRLRTMIRVVGELLTLAHTREQHPDTVRSPVDLRALTEQVVATFRDEAIRRGLDLTVSTSPDLPSVLGDADLLQQLVENLASNALKYTLSGGRVEIDLHRSERGGLTLEVRDTGIGIPREEQPRLFSEFFRASNARKLDEDGTGLGLPIIKQIVDRHGGEIQVESEPGKGTRMVVRLPAT